MAFGTSMIRNTRMLGTDCILRNTLAWLVLGALAVPAPAHADPKSKDVPRLGLDPAEPGVRSAPPATPLGISPSEAKDNALDFHGYLLLPLNLGVHDRENAVPGESGTVLHTPALIPQDYTRFQYAAVVPNTWTQLNLSYGNSTVAGTVILAGKTVYEGEAVYDPVKQLGVSNAYVTFNLKDVAGIPLQLRVGAMQNRYGAMGAFDLGRYATPLFARINAIGETATVAFQTGDFTFVVEQGFGGQLGRMPSGVVSAGWNDFGDPNVGSSYVSHGHAGISWRRLLQLGLHYATAWSQDDLNPSGMRTSGRITVFGADARMTAGRYGHLYAGIARTQATNARFVSGIIEVLNAPGGDGLVREYLGPHSNDGDGALTSFGFQYDLSISRLVYDQQYRGKGPDILFSLFGIGAKVKSSDPDYNGILKLKAGAEATYTLLSWLAVGGRADIVRQDNRYNRRSFDILTGRVLFHSGWLSRDEIALQYSHFVYGREVYVANGYPAVDDPTLHPDGDVLSLSATFWW